MRLSLNLALMTIPSLKAIYRTILSQELILSQIDWRCDVATNQDKKKPTKAMDI